jgi:hypothetical protein
MKCEKCNKEHDGSYGSGRFCNIKCANSRGPRSKEFKERISKKLKKNKKYYCLSCKDIIFNRKVKYCKECNSISNYINLFNTLNINESNLKIKNELATNILLDEYFENRRSCKEIGKKYNLHKDSIRRFLIKNRYNLRNLSKSQSILYERGIVDPPINYNYKTGYHITWEGKEIFYRSSYELIYAKKLDNNKIKYDVECLRIKYFDSQLNKTRIAIPDFYLPDTNTIVEIKSNWTLNEQNMKDKEKTYKELGYNFKLIIGQ